MKNEAFRVQCEGEQHGEWRARNNLPLDNTPCEQYDNPRLNEIFDWGETMGWFWQKGEMLKSQKVIDGWTLPRGWRIVPCCDVANREIDLWFYSRKGTEIGFKRMKF